MLINLVRIVLTAALSYNISLAMLSVLIHEITGTINFFIALTLFILLCEFLQRRFLSRGNMRPGAVCVDNEGNDGNTLAGVMVEKPSWRPSALAMAVLILQPYFASNVSCQHAMRLSTALASIAPQLARFEPAATTMDGFY